ncbi:hypothetical protein BJY04DRAFT_212586 [Aspergillus karnatakaensis]|uniref:uncharacterized protein n=1 Tax=Aspergillus karnatakaensis TaxID=1810916 RepID=UPI003CCD64A5
MASSALTDIAQARRAMQNEYGGKASNQFVDEVKSSALFQFSWGELLSAAPTALTLMGSLWIAASNPIADKISLADSMPTNGFEYLVKRRDPTLRSCLVDVCNNGGREAFTIAGANMDALQARSRRIVQERIDLVFKRLGPCTRDKYALEDFLDALQDFSSDAQQCATLATQTRQAFAKWGKMVGELHACTEQESGSTSQKREAVKVDQAVANIEKKFAGEAVEDAKTQAGIVKTQLERAEKRLDHALENVPGPWAQVAQAAVSGFAQAVPSIVAGALPAVLAAANPAYGISQALGAGVKQGANGAANTSVQGTDGSTQDTTVLQVPTTAADPAYAAALGIKDLTTHFYEYLGGEKGEIDLAKFRGTEGADRTDKTPNGETADAEDGSVAYLIGTLTSQRNAIDKTNTKPNKKLHAAFDKLIKVANAIRNELKNDSIKSDKIDTKIIAEWKKEVKAALNDILSLSSSAVAVSSNNSPGLIKIDVPKPDPRAQIAQVNGAMQQVQMTQTAVDAAQSNYDAALARQAKTAAAMAEVEKRLQRLKESAATLDEIKGVLRDCINVLVDLTVQVGKLERFFTMLTTIIDHVVLPRAQSFAKEMGKAGTRANERGLVQVDDIAKQTIYTSTLQVKAYFSLLEDISGMYSMVDRQYITYGVDLCARLSKGAAGNENMVDLQEELKKYSEASAKKVADMVDQKQKEILKGLRARADKALETTKVLEDTIQQRGIAVSEDSKNAIQAGADAVKAEAKELLDQEQCVTGTEQMAMDEL